MAARTWLSASKAIFPLVRLTVRDSNCSIRGYNRSSSIIDLTVDLQGCFAARV
jgi:hypothetical protein